MFDPAVREGVLRLRRPGARWLSSGWDGGFRRAPAAYNVSVPEGWERTDLGAYVAERRRAAGFEEDGPALLTAVDLGHARGARDGAVEAVVTAGVSNPATLPLAPEESAGEAATTEDRAAGTVNVVVGTDRSLTDGALADLLAVAVEAKTATLLGETGFPGTTTDAVVVACDPAGEPVTFAGSATPVGGAARACVRDALRASLRSRYPDGGVPASVDEAEHGVSTTRRADVFRVG
jgi:adenosylcobinamide hydrolase